MRAPPHWGKDITDNFAIRQIIPDGATGFIGVGDGDGGASNDGWIFRLDASGNLTWQKRLEGLPGNDYLYTLIPTFDRGWLVGGLTFSNGSQHWDGDAWVLKLDKGMTVLWQKRFRSSDQGLRDEVRYLVAMDDGTYMVFMQEYGNFYGPPVLMQLDGQGNVLWTRKYAVSGTTWFYWYSAALQTTSGGFILPGSDWDNDCLVFAIDAAGSILWKYRLKGRSSSDKLDRVYAACNSSDGNMVLADATNSYADTNDLWLIKMKEDGTILWQYRYKGSEDGIAYSITETADGNLVVGTDGPKIMKISPKGKLIWVREYAGLWYDDHTVVAAPDGGILLYAPRGNVVYKLDKDGNMPKTCSTISKPKLKPYKTTAGVGDLDVQTDDTLKMKKLSMNGKIVDTTEVVDTLCE